MGANCSVTNSVELFDTDFISEYIRDKPDAVARFRSTPRERRFTTIVSEAEIIGARYRQLLTAANEIEMMAAQMFLNVARDVFANSFAGVLETEMVSSRLYVELKQVKKLAKVDNADLIIASIALRHSATPVTGTVEHFRKVPRLKVEDFRRR